MSGLLIARQGWLSAAAQACGFILTLNPFEARAAAAAGTFSVRARTRACGRPPLPGRAAMRPGALCSHTHPPSCPPWPPLPGLP